MHPLPQPSPAALFEQGVAEVGNAQSCGEADGGMQRREGAIFELRTPGTELELERVVLGDTRPRSYEGERRKTACSKGPLALACRDASREHGR